MLVLGVVRALLLLGAVLRLALHVLRLGLFGCWSRWAVLCLLVSLKLSSGLWWRSLDDDVGWFTNDFCLEAFFRVSGVADGTTVNEKQKFGTSFLILIDF